MAHSPHEMRRVSPEIESGVEERTVCMHEAGLVADLVRRVEALAREHQARRVLEVRVRLGALAHLSPGHLREHFALAAAGTLAATARLEIEESSDLADPQAQDLVLHGIEVDVDDR